MKKLYALTALFIILTSCFSEKSADVTIEKLFDIDYGKLEDEIDLSQKKSLNIPAAVFITMKDGLIYILNGNLQKIMKFNSYGDLLLAIMNKELNPKPVIVENDGEKNLIYNKKGTFFPFRNIKDITVDSKQNIFISDILENSKQEWDPELKTMLTDIVYRFDDKGNYSDNIGQDGPGGMPFPYITDIKNNSANELVVITKTQKTNPVFWFDSNGKLLYQIKIDDLSIPISDRKDMISNIDSISIPQTGHKLFIKYDFYKKVVNENNKKQNNIYFEKSSIYILDLQSGKLTLPINIPDVFTTDTENIAFSEEKLQIIYNLLGITSGNRIFLTTIIDDANYKLLILNTEGKVLLTTMLKIEEKDLFNMDMNINDKGIITAILSGSDKSSVLWWRTDKLFRDSK